MTTYDVKDRKEVAYDVRVKRRSYPVTELGPVYMRRAGPLAGWLASKPACFYMRDAIMPPPLSQRVRHDLVVVATGGLACLLCLYGKSPLFEARSWLSITVILVRWDRPVFLLTQTDVHKALTRSVGCP